MGGASAVTSVRNETWKQGRGGGAEGVKPKQCCVQCKATDCQQSNVKTLRSKGPENGIQSWRVSFGSPEHPGENIRKKNKRRFSFLNPFMDSTLLVKFDFQVQNLI